MIKRIIYREEHWHYQPQKKICECITWKSETMAFLEQDPVGYKTVVGYKCLQQVNNFKYCGCEISYKNKKKYSTKT